MECVGGARRGAAWRLASVWLRVCPMQVFYSDRRCELRNREAHGEGHTGTDVWGGEGGQCRPIVRHIRDAATTLTRPPFTTRGGGVASERRGTNL